MALVERGSDDGKKQANKLQIKIKYGPKKEKVNKPKQEKERKIEEKRRNKLI
jgi:hypothetical protein